MGKFAHEAALRGARWLEEIRPGWADRVDWDILNLGSVTGCVAGQVFADCPGVCLNGYTHLSLCLGTSRGERVALGFLPPDDGAYDEEDLESAWHEVHDTGW